MMVKSLNSFLNISNLFVKFGEKTIINNLSLEIKCGEIISFLGESGSGKSTLLSSICGVKKPFSGDIVCNNIILSNGNKIFVEPKYRNFTIVFQDHCLFPHMTVRENISFGLKVCTFKNKDKVVQDAIDLMEISDISECYPNEISGGQRQRVSLARAIAPRPSLILLDEPFSSLDENLRCRLRDKIFKIFKEINATVILVTHSYEEASLLSDKIMLLNNGMVEQYSTPSELYNVPQTLYAGKYSGNLAFLGKDILNADNDFYYRKENMKILNTNISVDDSIYIFNDCVLKEIKFYGFYNKVVFDYNGYVIDSILFDSMEMFVGEKYSLYIKKHNLLNLES